MQKSSTKLKAPDSITQSKGQSERTGSVLLLDRHTKPCLILSSCSSCLVPPLSTATARKQPAITQHPTETMMSVRLYTLLLLFQGVEDSSLPLLATTTEVRHARDNDVIFKCATTSGSHNNAQQQRQNRETNGPSFCPCCELEELLLRLTGSVFSWLLDGHSLRRHPAAPPPQFHPVLAAGGRLAHLPLDTADSGTIIKWPYCFFWFTQKQCFFMLIWWYIMIKMFYTELISCSKLILIANV